MGTIIKWSLIILFSALVIWLLKSYYACWKKGQDSGKVYECNPFSSRPEFLTLKEVRHEISEGKCYEITDYGKKMSFRETSPENCS